MLWRGARWKKAWGRSCLLYLGCGQRGRCDGFLVLGADAEFRRSDSARGAAGWEDEVLGGTEGPQVADVRGLVRELSLVRRVNGHEAVLAEWQEVSGLGAVKEAGVVWWDD